MAGPRLIVGLGNPGVKYARTRHNIGFLAVDEIAASLKGQVSWKEQFGALIARVDFAHEDCVLVKPQSFMNKSGEPVREVLNFFKGQTSKMIVVHDEVDIPFGSLRIKQGGGDGGHNGLKSISQHSGSLEEPGGSAQIGYYRVRVGVGRPVHPAHELAAWVLEKFSSEEERILPSFLTQVRQSVELLCTEGLAVTQNKFNAALKL